MGSTGRDYLLARLKRDRPDIFAALERGEYRSARAAAKAAGIVHDLPPLAYLHRYWKKASTEERRAFVRVILASEEGLAYIQQRQDSRDILPLPPRRGASEDGATS